MKGIFKKIKAVFMTLVLLLSMAGCEKEEQHAKQTTENDEFTEEVAVTEAKHQELSKIVMVDGKEVMIAAPTVIEKPEDIAKFGESFETTFDEGLYYTINKAVFYDNLKDVGLTREDLSYPENLYEGEKRELAEIYNNLEQYVKEDGSVDEDFRLLMLDVTIKNENAVGIMKDNVFMMNSLTLYGGEPVTRYGLAYFSEMGKLDSEQIWHFSLQKGEELHVKIGYLILKEDVNDLVGIVNKNEYKYHETYFEIY